MDNINDFIGETIDSVMEYGDCGFEFIEITFKSGRKLELNGNFEGGINVTELTDKREDD